MSSILCSRSPVLPQAKVPLDLAPADETLARAPVLSNCFTNLRGDPVPARGSKIKNLAAKFKNISEHRVGMLYKKSFTSSPGRLGLGEKQYGSFHM